MVIVVMVVMVMVMVVIGKHPCDVQPCHNRTSGVISIQHPVKLAATVPCQRAHSTSVTSCACAGGGEGR